jgi:hypothetical protein
MRTQNTTSFMAIIAMALFLVASGCVSHSNYTVIPETVAKPKIYSIPSDAYAAWSPGVVAPYTLGRHIDPRDPSVLHEVHTAYRLEQSPTPNLMPPDSILFPGAPSSTNASSLALIRDALTAELNEQRATSAVLIEQAKSLNTILKEFDTRSQEFRDAAKKGLHAQIQLQAVSNRLEVLEDQLRRISVQTETPSTPKGR